jgi:MFS transporter, PAT family, solute carrier family 33 (acetyl-CoA transportor), member 1
MLCGLLMLCGARSIGTWMGDSGESPDVLALTVYFSVLYVMMATQDIAVDGWALTMLSRENVGYASTCNSLGQTMGFFLAHVGFLALNDAGICNKYLRSEGSASDSGMVSLSSFLVFWAIIFLATTLFVW